MSVGPVVVAALFASVFDSMGESHVNPPTRVPPMFETVRIKYWSKLPATYSGKHWRLVCEVHDEVPQFVTNKTCVCVKSEPPKFRPFVVMYRDAELHRLPGVNSDNIAASKLNID